MEMQKRKRSDSVLRHAKRFKNRFGKLDKRLEKLQELVGMPEVKRDVMGQLKFLLCNDGATDDHFLHTCSEISNIPNHTPAKPDSSQILSQAPLPKRRLGTTNRKRA